MRGIRYDFIAEYLTGCTQTHHVVLEVGCGSQQYRDDIDGKYWGLDLPSSEYLEDELDVAASAEQIPFRDAVFDLVFGVGVFLVIEDPLRALMECRRILRAGGHLLIFDYQKEILERLHTTDPSIHRNVWDFERMRGFLETAGFKTSLIRNISAVADRTGSPSYARLLFRRLRRRMGQEGIWLVVDAER